MSGYMCWHIHDRFYPNYIYDNLTIVFVVLRYSLSFHIILDRFFKLSHVLNWRENKKCVEDSSFERVYQWWHVKYLCGY